MKKITIPVESEIANLYENMDLSQQKKINLLLGMWLKEAITSKTSLEEIMDKCSQEVQDKGLTPEILEYLLLESQ